MLETSITPTDRDAMVRQFQRHLARRYEALPISNQVLKRARRLVRQPGLPHTLRTYDAIHLASALELRDRLQRLGLAAPIFVTADRKLLAIAEHLGLSIENPEDHP
jgi:predicted nucleic acid-binding protein